MGLYLGECVKDPRKSTEKCALALLEPLVLIPDPIASKMLDLALPENWIWDQGEGVLIPDSLLGHGPFCFVAGLTLRVRSLLVLARLQKRRREEGPGHKNFVFFGWARPESYKQQAGKPASFQA